MFGGAVEANIHYQNIKSPFYNWPQEYLDTAAKQISLPIRWQLTAEANKSIQLNFKTFEVRDGDDNCDRHGVHVSS